MAALIVERPPTAARHKGNFSYYEDYIIDASDVMTLCTLGLILQILSVV